MTQSDIDDTYGYVEFLQHISDLFEDKADYYLAEARQEQFKLDSLVHFCQTGNFFEYGSIPLAEGEVILEQKLSKDLKDFLYA